MQILVMGDFSGRANRGLEDHGSLQDRKVFAIDIERFDQVMCQVAPQLHLALGVASEPATKIEFFHLDDFHPDHLYERLAMFQALEQTRGHLKDPATFTSTAKTLTRLAQTGRASATMQASLDKDADKHALKNPDNNIEQPSLFEQLLSNQPAANEPTIDPDRTTQSGISVFIASLVTPHIVPEPDPGQQQLVHGIEAAIGHQMRSILHHPAFQQLEASWRSVDQLIRKLDVGNRLRLYLLDVSKQEIEADLLSVGTDLSHSALGRLLSAHPALHETTTRSANGTLLLVDFVFSAHSSDAQVLAALGTIAANTGGPLLAAADTTLLACESVFSLSVQKDWRPLTAENENAWQKLRRSQVAPWIGLCLPRTLLRLPYGENTDEIESFPFAEMGDLRRHECYLWGNSAFSCVLLIAQAFLVRAWQMSLGDIMTIDDLPAHVYKQGNETHLQACAEVYLSDANAEAISSKGFMPWLSQKNSNAIRLLRFQSIAIPLAALEGPWALD
ncbi:MAG: type VI secretion system contractile sheath domain-containing protein [Thiohalomonadales bacterium]